MKEFRIRYPRTIQWIDRFGSEEERHERLERGKDIPFYATEELVETDLFFYEQLIYGGMRSVINKITYTEFVILLGPFNGKFIQEKMPPEMVIHEIIDDAALFPFFGLNCADSGVDKDKLIETVTNFNAMEAIALLEFAHRFWNIPEDDDGEDKAMEKIGINKNMFKSPE